MDSTDVVNGKYYWYACASQFRFAPTRLEDSVRVFTVASGQTVQGREGRLFARPAAGSDRVFNQIRDLLSNVHERQHHIDFTTTPIGWLLWRISRAVASTRAFILQGAYRLGCSVPIELPWERWVQSLPPVFSTSVQELDKLLSCQQAIFGRERHSVQSFLSIANEANAILVERGELEMPSLKWLARSELGQPYLPPEMFSTHEIFEANARLKERVALETVGNSEDIKEWERSRVQGVYKPVYDFLMDQLGSSACALVATTMALVGPCDPGLPGEALLETTLPGWRLNSVVKTLQRIVWPASYVYSSMTPDTFEEIAASSGFTSPRQTLLTLSRRPINKPESHTRLLAKLGQDPERSIFTFLVYLEEQSRRGLEKRLISPLLSAHESFQPVFEFYADRVVVNLPSDQMASDLRFNAFACLIFDLLMVMGLQSSETSGFGEVVRNCRELERIFLGGLRETHSIVEMILTSTHLDDLKVEP